MLLRGASEALDRFVIRHRAESDNGKSGRDVARREDVSRDLHAAARGRSELTELEGVDHAFTGDGLKSLVHAVVPWLLTDRKSKVPPGTKRIAA